jgi:MFS transporter, ACS family, glucarate transporter
MFGFGLLVNAQQKVLTVAAAPMMPEVGLSQLQIGWLQQALIIGYTLLMIPGSVLGQRQGARRTFVILGTAAFLASVATPLAPYVFGGNQVFIVLFGLQLMLGMAQAAVFPVAAGVLETWFPPGRWALVQGLQTMGAQFGGVLIPPLIASLMSLIGWQRALIWTSLPAVPLIAAWAWYGRNSPREHPSVTPAELAEVGRASDVEVDSSISVGRVLGLLTDRNVLLLSISYWFMNYVFYLIGNWCFLYLIEVRHFSVLESGWLASAPPIAAAIGGGIGGALTGALCKSLGTRWGFRMVPLFALPMTAAMLLVAVSLSSGYAAVVALAACFGCLELTEGSFWGAGMMVGRSDSMAVCGVMNTSGSSAGIIGIPIIAYLSGHGSWGLTFLIGIGCALVSAVAWLGIDATRPVGGIAHSGSSPVTA